MYYYKELGILHVIVVIVFTPLLLIAMIECFAIKVAKKVTIDIGPIVPPGAKFR